MSCDNLGTLSNQQSILAAIEALGGRLSAIETKLGSLESRVIGIDSKIDQLIARDDKGQVIDNIWAFLAELVNSIVDPIITAVNILGQTVQNIVLGIRDVVLGAIDAIEAVIIQAIRSSEGVLVGAIDATESVINNAIDSTESVINTTINASERVITGAIDATESVINNAIDSSESVITSAITTTGQTIQRAIATVEDVLIAAIDGLESAISTMIDNVTKIMLSIIDRVADAIDSILQAVLPILGQIMETVAGLFTDIMEAIGPYFVEVSERIASLVNDLQRLITQPLADLLRQLLGDPDQGGDLYAKLTSYIGGDHDRVINAIRALLGEGVDLDLTDIRNLSNEIQQLMELLEQDPPEGTATKLDAIYNVLAPAQFEESVLPSSLLSGIGDQDVPIANYPDLFMWYIRQFDALIGEFPISIDIKDTDLTTEGDQSRSVKIGNLSEGIAEIFGIAYQQTILQDADLAILIRLIPEIIRIRQSTLLTEDLNFATADFLGYLQKEVKKEINSNFTLTKDPDDIAGLLAPETITYKSVSFDLDSQKDTLLDFLLRLQYAASISKDSIVKDFESLKDLLGNKELLNDDQVNDWNQFLEQINNPQSPFNYQEITPKIRDIESEGG